MIPQSTLTAYIDADYVVFADTSFTLKVGRYSPELQDLFQRSNYACAAFLTACNPFSQVVSDDENAKADQRLIGELAQRKLPYFSGAGRDPNAQWMDEASHLVLGLTLADGKNLGQQFKQNALVWADARAIPELILLR